MRKLLLLLTFPFLLVFNPSGAVVFTLDDSIAVFLSGFIIKVNPKLLIEDRDCVYNISWVIPKMANMTGVDWEELTAIAWKESDFDCHAKHLADGRYGNSYNPWQLNEVWNRHIDCDVRARYWDVYNASRCVVAVINKKKSSRVYRLLTSRGFEYPLSCMWNGGYPKRGVSEKHRSWKYCVNVSEKIGKVQAAYDRFIAGSS